MLAEQKGKFYDYCIIVQKSGIEAHECLSTKIFGCSNLKIICLNLRIFARRKFDNVLTDKYWFKNIPLIHLFIAVSLDPPKKVVSSCVVRVMKQIFEYSLKTNVHLSDILYYLIIRNLILNYIRLN